MKSSRRDLWLMLVPVLILAGVGLALRNRSAVTLQVGEEPFRLKIKRVRFEPLTPREVHDGYDARIAVDLSHQGKKPAWWTDQGGYQTTEVGTLVFEPAPGAKTRRVLAKEGYPIWPNRTGPVYQKGEDGFTARYVMALRHVPVGDAIRLRDHLAVHDTNTKLLCAPIWLDTVVRKRGQRIVLPKVSHDPEFKLDHYGLEAVPRAEVQDDVAQYLQANGQQTQYRLRLFVRRTGPKQEAERIGASFDLVDAKGESFGYEMESSQALELPNQSDVINIDILPHYENLPRKGPLWLVGKVGFYSKWPLEIRIPYRDAQGKIVTRVGTKPAFRIVSATSGPITNAGGADTVVKFEAQPVGKLDKPMIDWKWEIDYSQHVVDAHGKQYWRFPFSGGAEPAPSESSYTQTDINAPGRFEIIYHLNLSKIPKSAGRLTFKATISANGSQRVPVSVVVRR